MRKKITALRFSCKRVPIHQFILQSKAKENKLYEKKKVKIILMANKLKFLKKSETM